MPPSSTTTVPSTGSSAAASGFSLNERSHGLAVAGVGGPVLVQSIESCNEVFFRVSALPQVKIHGVVDKLIDGPPLYLAETLKSRSGGLRQAKREGGTVHN